MVFRIPLFDLNYGEDEIAAVAAAIRDGWISMGPRCVQFEEEFARALGCRHAVSLDNCTNALHLALRLLGVGPGDEVLVPSLTFVATVNCVRYVGAEPVFCDVSSQSDLCISPEDMRRNLTGKTRAVIVMHYGGFPCRMTEILDIARAHDLRVVEDACHGPLSEYNGMKLGTLGDVGCFSFFSNKNISTGEGGMMVMRDASLYEKARLLRSHGMTTSSYQRAGGDATRYDVVDLGYNFRMDDMRAALGLVQLRKLKPDLEKRAAVRRWYLEGLERLDDVTVPFAEHTGYVSNYIMSVIVRDGGSDRRDAIREHLHKSGVQTSIHYPAVHRFSIYRDRGASVPVTEMAADHLVTLPMHSKLTKDDVDFVTAELGKALQV